MIAGYKVEIKKVSHDNTTAPITFTQRISIKQSEVLLKASLSKQMYKPGCLEVEIQTEKSIDDFRNKLITLSDDTTIYAKDYFIFNIKQKNEKIIIKAYSVDYFLTIDKFCQAFTAKTLVDEIVKPSLQNCQSVHFDKFREIVTGTKDGDISNYVVNNVHNFQGTSIPYTVQYNESFYDFLKRLCNRDGEFLYLSDDNKLNIGLKSENSVNLSDLNTTELECIDSYDESSDTTWVDRNYLSTSEGFNDKEEEGVKNKIHTSFGVLAPEYLEKIETEVYNTWKDYTHPYTEICNIFRALALERTLKDALLTAIRVASVYNSHYDFYRLYFDTIYKRRYPINTLLYSSNEMVRDNKSYQELYASQEEANQGKLKVTITGKTFLKLGDIVNYKKTSYVVYEVVINTTLDSNNNYNEESELLLVQQTSKGFLPLPMPEIRICKASAQSAIVVDNFDPDRLGRVRVKYPWQDGEVKDEEEDPNKINSTPWIRVSTPMASDGAGFLFTPCIKDEVLVDYEDGNIERPFVSGSFYSKTNKPSFASKSQTRGIVKSITSSNGHHLSFTDVVGGERYISNMLPITRMFTSFGFVDNRIFEGEYTKYFGGGFELADYYGIYSITGSSQNRSIDIKSPFGNVNISAFQGVTIDAPMGEVKIVGKNVSIEARNNLTITSGTNIPGYFANRENFKLPIEMLIIGGKVTGLDLSFIRSYLEVILRPIGGNMLIKSNRYLRLEAGDGETIIERDRANNTLGSFLACSNDKNVVDVLLDTIRHSIAISRNYRSMCEKWASLSNMVKRYRNTAIKSVGESIVTELGVLTEEELENRIYSFSSDEIGLLKAMRRDANEIIDIKEKLFENYKLCTKDIKNKIEAFDDIFKSQMKNWDKDEEAPTTFTTKELLYRELKNAVETQKNLNEVVEMDKWSDGIVIDEAVRRKDNSKITFKGVLKTLAIESMGISGYKKLNDERAWTEREKGAILISDDKKNFFKIRNDGTLQKSVMRDYDKFIIDTINSIDD